MFPAEGCTVERFIYSLFTDISDNKSLASAILFHNSFLSEDARHLLQLSWKFNFATSLINFWGLVIL